MDKQKLVFYLGMALLAGIVAYSFAFIGSPMKNRKLLEDKLRIDNLDQIDCFITSYYKYHNRLPATLADAEQLGKDSRGNSDYDCGHCYMNKETKFTDPVSGAVIKYTPAYDSYTICSDFNFGWDEMKDNKNIYNRDWAKGYTAGEYCFKRTMMKCKKKDR